MQHPRGALGGRSAPLSFLRRKESAAAGRKKERSQNANQRSVCVLERTSSGMDKLSHLCGSEGYGACEDAISISPFAIPLKRPKGLRPFWISQGVALLHSDPVFRLQSRIIIPAVFCLLRVVASARAESYQTAIKLAARMRRVVPQSRASARNISRPQLFFLHTFSGAAEKVCLRSKGKCKFAKAFSPT